MDWSKTEMMGAVADLAKQILSDDPSAWSALVEAQLLEVDDLLDVAALIDQVGRTGAFVPVLETLCLGWPIRQADMAPEGAVLTGALHEVGARHPRHARTEVRDGRAYGTKLAVPAVGQAAMAAVAAADGVYAVRIADCAFEHGEASNDDPVSTLILDGVPAERIGGPELFGPWTQRVDLGICALLLGLAKTGLKLTSAYVSERQQFGRPIGTFQAVGQRAADAWIDVQGMEVALWSAAWRLQQDPESPEAGRALLIARWQASEGAHRVLAAAQHLHGGMGYDKDYPLYRYTLTAARWEHTLGGPGARLERLGELLAAG